MGEFMDLVNSKTMHETKNQSAEYRKAEPMMMLP